MMGGDDSHEQRTIQAAPPKQLVPASKQGFPISLQQCLG